MNQIDIEYNTGIDLQRSKEFAQELRKRAKQNGTFDMSLDEMNNEIMSNKCLHQNKSKYNKLKAFGCLKKYANKEIIGKEREIISEAIVEKHMKLAEKIIYYIKSPINIGLFNYL